MNAQVDAIMDLPERDELKIVVFHDFVENPEGASVTQVGSVKRAVERLENESITYTLEEASGTPKETILATAEEVEANVICVGARRRTPTGKAMFGSVTQAVVLNADRPVMVVPVDLSSG